MTQEYFPPSSSTRDSAKTYQTSLPVQDNRSPASMASVKQSVRQLLLRTNVMANGREALNDTPLQSMLKGACLTLRRCIITYCQGIIELVMPPRNADSD